MHVYLGHDEQPPVAFLSRSQGSCVGRGRSVDEGWSGICHLFLQRWLDSSVGWDAVTGNRIFNLKGQRNKVLSLRLLDPRVCPTILLSGGEDKYVHVWNLTTGEPVRVMSGHEDEVRDVFVIWRIPLCFSRCTLQL